MAKELGILLLLSYLLGSIPFGFLLAKWLKGIDLRTIGSGNIGATNASRALGRWAAIVVYLLDFAKGFIPVITAEHLFVLDNNYLFLVIIGSAAIAGHCFPIYLKFKGGKGVATTTGVLMAIDYEALLLAGGVWLVTLLLFRYVSLASILLSLSLPCLLYFMDPEHAWTTRLPLIIFGICLALFIVFTHRENLKRLVHGTESRIFNR